MNPKVEKSLEDVVARVQELRASSRAGRVRWPQEFKAEIAALLKQGVSISHLQRATGIAHETLRSCHRGQFRAVEVKAANPRGLHLQLISGHEVSGLSVKDVVTLLQAGVI